MITWTELTYEMQMKALDRIGMYLSQEEDHEMQVAIAAAIAELEIWSNSPCYTILPDIESESKPNVAEVTDLIIEKDDK